MGKFNGFIERGDMTPGSHTDMKTAYVFRAFLAIMQSVGALALWALVTLFVSIRDDMRDIKKEWPEVKKNLSTLTSDVGELKKNAATKDELKEAEMRVKTEFIEQLKRTKNRVASP